MKRIAVVVLFLVSSLPLSLSAQSSAEARLDIHYRPCATAPANGVSWYDHCHDGPLRLSATPGFNLFLERESLGAEVTAATNGNDDATFWLQQDRYQLMHPPLHDATDWHLSCSRVDDAGNPVSAIDDPYGMIAVQTGDHIVCDFYVVWGMSGFGQPVPAANEPQGSIEVRWRACAEVPAGNAWYNNCFAADSPLGIDPAMQEGRFIYLNGNASDGANLPYNGNLDANGNALITVPVGEWTVQAMQGDFVVADYLFCSTVGPNRKAIRSNIPTNPIVIENGTHIICDYYYVAN